MYNKEVNRSQPKPLVALLTGRSAVEHGAQSLTNEVCGSAHKDHLEIMALENQNGVGLYQC